MKTAIVGATGLVGRALTARLLRRGDRVTALTRDPGRAAAVLPAGVGLERWTAGEPAPLGRVLSGLDAVVFLAGEPILGKRWSRRFREVIRASRVEGVRTVVRALAAADPRPRVLVSASASGYYGPRGDEEITEDEPPGSDFLAGVCAEWEGAAREAEALGVRVVLVRIGVVLSAEGGALPRMLPPFRWFLGGPVGKGRQGFPWIHVEDLAGILLHALDHGELRGPVNAAAPGPVSQAEFSRALGRAIRRPSWLPVPRPVLRILLGPVARVLTTGQRLVPKRARETGYRFRFTDPETAVRDLLGKPPGPEG